MWHVPTVKSQDARTFLEKVRDAKRDPILLLQQWSNIEGRLDIFDNNWPKLDKVSQDPTYAAPQDPKSPNRLRNALIGLYENDTNALGKIKQAVRDCVPRPKQSLCPYCGFGEPKTFDHQLTKTDFPEYAAYACNLVSACSTCNTFRGTLPASDIWLPAVDDPQTLPPVLNATLRRDQDWMVADFTISINTTCTLTTKVNSAADKLQLRDRWSERSIVDLDEQRRNVRSLRSKMSFEQIHTCLDEAKNDYQKNFGVNYYLYALHTAIVGSGWGLFKEWVNNVQT